jgi:hypothetical protein
VEGEFNKIKRTAEVTVEMLLQQPDKVKQVEARLEKQFKMLNLKLVDVKDTIG